jgi:hypothetical protein
MEMKLVDIQRAKPALTKILNANLPIKVAFRLGRLAKEVDKVLVEIEDIRSKLVQKYGSTTEQGVSVKPENIAKFQEEFSSFLSEESIDLDVEPIKLDLLGDLELTPLDVVSLDFLLEE